MTQKDQDDMELINRIIAPPKPSKAVKYIACCFIGCPIAIYRNSYW
jgi:hypothetical protein